MRRMIFEASLALLVAGSLAHAEGLHFRGTLPGDVTWQRDGRSIAVPRMAGRYFIDADSSDRVLVTYVGADRVRLESPGQWVGAGTLHDSTYSGVFLYRDDVSLRPIRGARGTHLGTIEPTGRIRIMGTFTNRPWAGFESAWTPAEPKRDSTTWITRERLRNIPVDEMLQHPIWPPEQGRAPGPDYENPIWPPGWYKGDTRIVPAGTTAPRPTGPARSPGRARAARAGSAAGR